MIRGIRLRKTLGIVLAATALPLPALQAIQVVHPRAAMASINLCGFYPDGDWLSSDWMISKPQSAITRLIVTRQTVQRTKVGPLYTRFAMQAYHGAVNLGTSATIQFAPYCGRPIDVTIRNTCAPTVRFCPDLHIDLSLHGNTQIDPTHATLDVHQHTLIGDINTVQVMHRPGTGAFGT